MLDVSQVKLSSTTSSISSGKLYADNVEVELSGLEALKAGNSYVLDVYKRQLLYPEKFTGETRSVYLIGEANFKVKPDKKHPFIVKANDYQVTALGLSLIHIALV